MSEHTKTDGLPEQYLPAAEKSVAGKIVCNACPVLCQISDGRTGACDRYANNNGALIRVDPVVVLSRTPDSQQKLFTSVRASRMRPDQVVNTVQNVTGDLGGKARNAVSRAFNVDPSAPQGMLEGSIQQALLLMNNPQLQASLAKSKLKSELMKIKSDDEMIDFLYFSTVSRHASDREKSRGKDYLKQVSNRSDAIDDLLWALVNSTEFLTKK